MVSSSDSYVSYRVVVGVTMSYSACVNILIATSYYIAICDYNYNFV